MLKIIGLIMIVVTSTAVGFYIPRLEKHKIDFLNDFRQSLYLLRNEINYAVNTLISSFYNIYERSNNKNVKQFYYEMYEELESRGSSNLKEVWENKVDKLNGQVKLKDSEISYIKAFGNSLGYLDKDLQLKNIDMLVENLNEELEKSKEVYDKHNKLYARMGIMVGLIIGIVML